MATPRQRIEIRMSERRAEMDSLIGDGSEPLSDDDTAKLIELRKAQTADDAALLATEPHPTPTPPDQPDAARLELRANARAGDFLRASVGRGRFDGASAELAAENGCAANQIPFELFAPTKLETRADAASAAPSSGTGVNIAPIQPFVFASSVAPMLGIDMPTVPSGAYSVPTITTALTADAKAKGAAAESTAAVIAMNTMTPKRVSGRLTFRIEDVATFGSDDFEAALRRNLQTVMSDALDTRLLNDQDTGTNAEEPAGLIEALTAPTAAADTVTWGSGVGIFAALIDGLWARSMMEIGALVNATTMAKLETTFREPAAVGTPADTYSDTPGETSLAAYLRGNLNGIVAHNRMPASASNVATGVAFRAGDGVMERPDTAVCANWGRVEITDPYSDSGSAETHVTVHSLVSDVKVLYAAAYALFSIKSA